METRSTKVAKDIERLSWTSAPLSSALEWPHIINMLYIFILIGPDWLKSERINCDQWILLIG